MTAATVNPAYPSSASTSSVADTMASSAASLR